MYLDNFITKASKTIFSYSEPIRYLNGRGITEEDIKKYSIGYLKAVSIKEDGSEDYIYLKDSTYSFKSLRNRLIFPLRNILGHTNGVVVRDLDRKNYIQYFLKEAKAIGAFFGLYEALPHIIRTKKVFVHEGAINSISFAKIFPNSISSLTSILNDNQYETLLMFADKIILVFDEDDPGRLGLNQILEKFGNKYLDSINLGYNDSNACLQKMGFDSFKKYIINRIPILLRN